MTHTPGPWELPDQAKPRVSAKDATGKWTGMIATVDAGDYARSYEEGMANARLIAASPDLLEALKQVLASLVATTSLIIRAEDMKVTPSKAVASDKMFRQMLSDYDKATIAGRDAIAKAEAA